MEDVWCVALGFISALSVLFPTGTVEPVGVKNNGDGTHTVHYTPGQDGPYTVAVKYADQEVPHRYLGRYTGPTEP